MPRIRIYVEGGGDSRQGKRAVRLGFGRFLREFAGDMPAIIACGGRGQAYSDFLTGVRANPDDFVILLVDAEGPVTAQSRRQHLTQGDGWDLSGADEEQVHLMVQAVEAWLLADAGALAAYYRQHFQAGGLPAARNPEDIPKHELKRALANVGGQRGYNEITDCPKILAKLDPSLIRGKCSHCRALFAVLCQKTGRAPLPERT